MTNKFKIQPFEVVNKVADLLVINVNTQLFSGKAQGQISLEVSPKANESDLPAPVAFGEQVYSESFSLDYDAGSVEELVKAAAAKQLGVILV